MTDERWREFCEMWEKSGRSFSKFAELEKERVKKVLEKLNGEAVEEEAE